MVEGDNEFEMVKKLLKERKKIKFKQALVAKTLKEELTEKELKQKIKKLE